MENCRLLSPLHWSSQILSLFQVVGNISDFLLLLLMAMELGSRQEQKQPYVNVLIICSLPQIYYTPDFLVKYFKIPKYMWEKYWNTVVRLCKSLTYRTFGSAHLQQLDDNEEKRRWFPWKLIAWSSKVLEWVAGASKGDLIIYRMSGCIMHRGQTSACH